MEPKKSIYHRAGEWGFPFGLYLSCAAAASIFADWFVPLNFIFIVLLLGTPYCGILLPAAQIHRG